MNIARLSKRLTASTLAALSIMLAGSANGQSSGDYNGFVWYSHDGTTAEITGYDGPGGNVAIPSVVIDDSGTNYLVTSIGGDAFEEHYTLTSVTIPAGVIDIGTGAFYDCSSLTTVSIPDGVTSIGDGAFESCSNLISIVIPDSVTGIGNFAFESCASLTNVTIGSSVTSIGDYAFDSCISLTSVTIPESVSSIGVYAFWNCYRLTAILVDAQNLFYSSANGVLLDKNQLTLVEYPAGLGGSYTIPRTVTSIGEAAFQQCSNLTSVTIPNSVTSIGYQAFTGCTGLTSVTMPNSVTSLGGGVFAECYNLSSVTIPDSIVSSIGTFAFAGDFCLTNVTIPNSVPSIGDYAFYFCTRLTNLTIGSGVTSIGQQAFAYNYSLNNVCFEGNEPTDGGSIFYDDPALSMICHANGNTNWGSSYDGLPTAPCAQCGGGVTITGHVYCNCDNSPVAGASVILYASTGVFAATSASNGTYSISSDISGEITGIMPGTYPVTVTGAYYSLLSTSLTIPSGSSIITTNFMLTPNGTDPALVAAIVTTESIVPRPVNNGTAIYASFTPGLNLTVSQAACRLGFDHFNWLQWASGNSYRGVLYDCSRTYLPIYFIDPPYEGLCAGGPYWVTLANGTQVPADNFPPYFNEETGVEDPFYWGNKVVNNNYIWFDDDPSLTIPGDIASFITILIGVNSDQTYFYLGQFQWITTFNGTFNNVRVLAASEFALTNGTGGISNLQTNLNPVNVPASVIAMFGQIGFHFPATIQPASQTVVSGANVIFAISPTNFSSPLNCQWRKNGASISSATNLTLQLLNITTNSTGNYDAVLSTTNGSIASAIATLMVLNAPLFQSPVVTSSGIILSWAAAQGKHYQLQYTTNLNHPNWTNLGTTITASNTLLSVSNTFGSDKERFYRVHQQ